MDMKKTASSGRSGKAGAKPRRRSAGKKRADSPKEDWEGIGRYAESELHAGLKEYLARHDSGGAAACADMEAKFEVELEGKVIDLVRERKGSEELVEVQTRQLYKIVPKLLALAEKHKVRVVHPVPVELTILRIDPGSGELLSTRKSPKKGDYYSIFDELIRSANLIAAHNITVEVLLVKTRELRSRDGSGSWRRRGDHTLSRELVEVVGRRSFQSMSDWLALIPAGLKAPWSSLSLSEAAGISRTRAQQILYCYARAGIIKSAGKEGRSKLYMPLGRAELRVRNLK